MASIRGGHALWAAFCGVWLLPPTLSAQQQWALTHVTVIDVIEGRSRSNQTIHVAGDRIIAVGPADSLALPATIRRVEAVGTFVIPGLYDMHTHLIPTEAGDPPTDVALRSYVRTGVLGLRDVGAPLDSILRLSRSLGADTVPRPRLWFAGPVLDGPRRITSSDRIIVTDTTEARRVVDRLATAGVQFIKVHDWLSPRVYAAITREARTVGLPVVGHIPAAVTADDVIEAGQRSVEHLGGLTHGVLRGCARGDQAKHLEVLTLGRDNQFAAYRLAVSRAYLQPLLDGFDPAECAALAKRFAERRVAQVPTLVLFRKWAQRPDSELIVWHTDRAILEQLLATQLRVVGLMNQAGVQILAGVDNTAGVTVQDEIALLVEGGLSTAAALRAGTIAPAEFLGVTDSMGTVAAGRVADFVVLEADPLIDINNTRRIHAVVVRGHYLDEAALLRLGKN